MIFTGTYARTIDEKGRVAIPKPVRAALASGEPVVYLTPGTDGSLYVFSEAVFETLAERLATTSPTQEEVRAFSRLFYGQAERIPIDRQGRIRLPAGLATWAGLDREAVLLGVRDHLELWDRRRWEAYREKTQPRYDEFAADAFREG